MHYTKKLIYCGTQHNELLPVYITTIIQIHSKWGGGAFGGMAPHQATCLEDDPNSYDQSLLKENLAKHHWMGLWWCNFNTHSWKSNHSNTVSKIYLGLKLSAYNYNT
jgi:hypothetical protein